MPLSRPSRATANVGVYLGKITRVDGRECYLTVPALAGAYEYGPARYPAANAPGRRTDLTGGEGLPQHRHPLGEDQLKPGDRVAVAFLEGGRDELVVLVRLA